MTRWQRTGFAAAFGLALSGCGQKGPLYLPDDVGEVVTRPMSTTGSAPVPAPATPAGTTGDAASPAAAPTPAAPPAAPDDATPRKPPASRAPSPAEP